MDNRSIEAILGSWYQKTLYFIPCILSLATLLVYAPSLWYGFMFDDLPTITNYIHIRNIDFKGQFFANPRWISRLANQITYALWGNSALAYRIVNLCMHLAIGIMIFFLLMRLFSLLKRESFLRDNSLIIATMTSALFLLHPVQTQTVTYITQMRLEGLVVLFTVGTMLLFVYAATTLNSRLQKMLYASALIMTAFAAGTKEIVITMPVLMILIDWFFIAEGDWKSFKSRAWFHVICSIILYGLMMKYNFLTPSNIKIIATTPVHNNRGNILTKNATEYITMFPYFISQFKVLLHYLFIFFFPIMLSFDYDTRLSESVHSADVIFPFMLLVLLGGVSLWFYRTNKTSLYAFCCAWFFVSMLPRASFIPSTELICDYKTYPAAFGVMLLLAYLIVKATYFVLRRFSLMSFDAKVAKVTACALSVFCLVLGASSAVRNRVWGSELAFWEDAIAKAPKARGFNNYAIALWESGKSEEAIQYFQKAIEKDDWYAEPHVNLATIYQMRSDTEKALDHYQRALEIGEAHPELFNNLGMLHFGNQSWEAAEYCLKEAVALKPYYSKPNFNLGKLYQILNKPEEALKCYQIALKGDAPDTEMYYVYGVFSMDLGNVDEAIRSLEKIDKNYQDTAFLLGCCYYSKPSFARAADYFALAYQKDSNNRVCIYNYAQTLMNLRRYPEALALYDRCLDNKGEYPYLLLHRTKCLYEVGRQDEAKHSIKEMLASKPPKDLYTDILALQKELKLS